VIRSYLSRHQPRTPTDDEELRRMAQRAWTERGVAVLWPHEIQNDWDRQAVVNIANQKYGRQKL